MNSDERGGYEPGWVDVGRRQHRADEREPGRATPTYADVDEHGGQPGEPADQLRELVRGVRVLHLGRRLPAERGGVGVRGGGGSQQREYPWGTTAPGTARTSTRSTAATTRAARASCTGVTNIAPVGTATLGAGLWGQLDLAGNVWEWNLDWYATHYVDPCTDCANLTAASYRVRPGRQLQQHSIDLAPPEPPHQPPGGPQLRHRFSLRQDALVATHCAGGAVPGIKGN